MIIDSNDTSIRTSGPFSGARRGNKPHCRTTFVQFSRFAMPKPRAWNDPSRRRRNFATFFVTRPLTFATRMVLFVRSWARRSAMLMRALIGTLASDGKKEYRGTRTAKIRNYRNGRGSIIASRAFVIQRVSFISRNCQETVFSTENSIIPVASNSRKNISHFNGRDARKFAKLCHTGITVLMRITNKHDYWYSITVFPPFASTEIIHLFSHST